MRLDFLIAAAETEAVNAQKAERNGNFATALQKYKLSAKKYREASEACPERSLEFLKLAEKYENTVLPASGALQAKADKKPAKEQKIAEVTQTQTAPQSNEEELEEALAKLNALIGLDAVKKSVNDWVMQIKVFNMRKDRGMKVPAMSYHLVFTGNPGTGKTTVARLMGKIYHALGILEKGHLVEVDRGGLVAQYVGQTAVKTREAIQKAYGGVLFIDEVYSLAREGSNDFGQEAIEILLKEMEDNRNNLVVVVAGYEKLMDRFISSNPGLKSRFKNFVKFPDYTGEQLLEIFKVRCKDDGYSLSGEAEECLKAYFNDLYENRNEEFGNGRDVRNFFEETVTRQSVRVAGISNPTDEQLRLILPEDLIEKE